MRGLLAFCLLLATPAMAHHEVVVVTSMLPFAGGVAAICAAALLRWRHAVKKRVK